MFANTQELKTAAIKAGEKLGKERTTSKGRKVWQSLLAQLERNEKGHLLSEIIAAQDGFEGRK
jgi:hypothetical protein